jgi:hypothetical protein
MRNTQHCVVNIKLTQAGFKLAYHANRVNILYTTWAIEPSAWECTSSLIHILSARDIFPRLSLSTEILCITIATVIQVYFRVIFTESSSCIMFSWWFWNSVFRNVVYGFPPCPIQTLQITTTCSVKKTKALLIGNNSLLLTKLITTCLQRY